MSWQLDFDSPGVRGSIAHTVGVGRSHYRVQLMVPDVGCLVVDDDEHVAPRPGLVETIRGDGLWAELVCETPGEHWSLGLEAFGLIVDDPADTVGERVPVGFDLEFESDGTPASPDGMLAGTVCGEVLVERATYALETVARFRTETFRGAGREGT